MSIFVNLVNFLQAKVLQEHLKDQEDFQLYF